MLKRNWSKPLQADARAAARMRLPLSVLAKAWIAPATNFFDKVTD